MKLLQLHGTGGEVDHERVLPGQGAIALYGNRIRAGVDRDGQQKIVSIAPIIIGGDFRVALPERPDGIQRSVGRDGQCPGVGHGNLKVIDIMCRSDLTWG